MAIVKNSRNMHSKDDGWRHAKPSGHLTHRYQESSYIWGWNLGLWIFLLLVIMTAETVAVRWA